ncbi:MAG: hypothetical protein WC629_02260 [Candidatus Paceibacterota bacterium]|jgi:hypothetical protein
MKKYVNFTHKHRKIIFLVIILVLIVGIVLYAHQKGSLKNTKSRNNPSNSINGTKISSTSTRPVPNSNLAPIIPASFSVDGKDGSVRILGVKIVTVENKQIITSGFINGSSTIFVLNIDKDTIIKKGNTTVSIKSLKPGNLLFVTGTIESFTPNITITAKIIKFFAQ